MERLSLWSELSYDIAHELRNPASIVGGFAALMLKSPDLPNSLQENAKIIQSECARLEKALNTLLDFSRTFSQESSQFDMESIIEETLRLMQARLGENLYHLEFTSPKEKSMVFGKRDQIQFAVYAALSLMEEGLGEDGCVKIEISSADNIIKTLFDFSGMEDKGLGLFRDIHAFKTGKLALKLSMAIEAIKYNAGRLGIEAGEQGRARLFIDLPAARSMHA